MAIVLPVSRNLGGNIGAGLAEGLGKIAQQKLDKIQQNMVIHEGTRQLKGLFPGINDSEASALSYLKATDPKSFQGAIKAIFLGGGFGGDGGAEEGSFQEQQGPGQSVANQFQQPAEQQQSPLQSLNIPQKPNALGFGQQLNQASLNSIIGNDSNIPNLLASISGNQQAQQQVLNQQNPQQPQQQFNRPGAGPVEPGSPSAVSAQQPNKRRSLSEVIQKGSQNPDLEIRKEALVTKKEALAEQKKQNRINNAKPFVKQLEDDRKSRNAELAAVQQLKEIDLEGKVDSPEYLALLEKLNADYGFLKTDETVTYDKALAQLFQASLKGVQGIKNLEIVRGIKKGIPDLKSSRTARLRVLDGIEKNIKARELIDQEYSKVLEENDQIPPDNASTLVQRRVEPQLKEVFKKTSADIERALKGKDNVVEEFQSLPPAKDLPGKRIEFPDGSIRKSEKVGNEYKWVKV